VLCWCAPAPAQLRVIVAYHDSTLWILVAQNTRPRIDHFGVDLGAGPGVQNHMILHPLPPALSAAGGEGRRSLCLYGAYKHSYCHPTPHMPLWGCTMPCADARPICVRCDDLADRCLQLVARTMQPCDRVLAPPDPWRIVATAASC
jgi:hypothetical protein